MKGVSGVTHLRLNIKGMSGPACQGKIERAMRSIAGVYASVVCLDRGYADVEYEEDEVDAERILGAIRHAGYTVKLGG